MVKEHTFTITVRENREVSEEEENNPDYCRCKLLSTIMRYLVDSDLNVKIKYLESSDVPNPDQIEMDEL